MMKKVDRKAKKVECHKQTRLGRIPEDWMYEEIGNQIDLLSGFAFESESYATKGIRLLRGSNIKRGNTDWSPSITQFWDADVEGLDKYKLEDGDLVIAMDGSLVGRSFALLTKEDLPALLLQRVARIRSSKIDIGFLKEYIGSNYFVSYCDSVKTVTAIPHISSTDIKKFKIAIPPLPEQQKIARILSTWDKAIEKTEQLIAQKQLLKKGLMQQLLTGKVRFKKFVKSKKMKKTKLGLIPEEWEIKTIADVAEIHVGRDLKEDSFSTSENSVFKFPVFSNTVDNYGLYGYYDFMEYKGDSVTIVGRGVGLGTAFTRTGGYGAIGRLLVLFPKKELSANFLTEYANNRMNFFHESSGIPQLTGEQVAKYEIVIPSLLEQERISTSLKISDKEINLLKDKLSELKIQKKGLMQQLLTGKIRVKLN